MQYLKNRPHGFWALDSIADISGYGNDATLTGTQTKGISVSAYAIFSQVVNSSHYLTFPQSVYISGQEQQPFSLVASVFLPDTGSFVAQQILSNNSHTDGLSINGSVLTFSTAYASTGAATCTYNVPVGQKLDIVGVHTPSKNFLFINGVAVDEVDITQDQQSDAYITTDGKLYAGKIASQNLLINSVAIYPRALALSEITSMYSDNNYISVSDPYNAYVGELIDISTTTRSPYLNIIYENEDDWENATLTSVYVDDEELLRPEMVSSFTVGGTWTDSISLDNGDSVDTLDSLNIYWYGLNVTIQATVDGTTWETVQPGVNITSVPTGFDPTGKVLTLQVTFTAGQDDAWLEDLQVFGYLTNTVQQPNGRTIVYTAPVSTFADQQPSLLYDNWGTKIFGGSLDISTDTSSSSPITVETVEIWIKQLGSSAPTLSSNLTTGTTIYTNGFSGTTLRRGEWNIQHYVNASGITGDLIFSGNVQIGRVVVYDSALTSNQVNSVYDNYIGRDFGTRESGGSITIEEHSPPANIYAHDWATTS